MRPILKKKGLPEDTVYLAMIESGFSSRARSTVGAGGFWQFMPATGKVYGLSQTTWVDERRDFIMATESAAHFLTDLHREFKDWHLAWAGYNAGGGRIRRALKRHGATTFWDLADNPKSLVQETRHYVPKIIAAAIVAKNREKYGFAPASYKKSLSWDEFQVESSTDLRIVAKYLHIPITQLRTLNPAYFLDITPPNKKSTLRVPKGKG
ncbi:lytic transglycosylase domain-containing protein, partial [Myxococcota bacterium]|nr:lytic transglycosylase domain-containing protein [Myxococcota bacterium]